jgi:HSP20 family protein
MRGKARHGFIAQSKVNIDYMEENNMYNMIPFRRTANHPGMFDDKLFRSLFDFSDFGSGFRVDVRDNGDSFTMEAELPGLRQEDVVLTVNDDVLTISATRKQEHKEEKESYLYMERRNGRFQRSFTLEGIDHERIDAEYKDGILTVTMPKLAPEKDEKRQRKIPINGMNVNANEANNTIQ